MLCLFTAPTYVTLRLLTLRLAVLGVSCILPGRWSGVDHEGVVRWFEKANMLKATNRLFEHKLNKTSESEYNLNDHIAKFAAAKILIEHNWWTYAMIDSSVTPSKENRPNDMSICIRNTEEDLLQACDVCNGDRKENCKMCRALMHQRWLDIELKAGMANLGQHEYGRLFQAFSLTPGNQAHVTTTLILWHKQTQRTDTSSKLASRFSDPQSMLTTSTVSRIALNATISYTRRNFFTTTSIKKAFEEAGIEVDKRSEIMTKYVFEKRISLPQAYTYLVQMIPSCKAGDLNSVLHGLGSMTNCVTGGGAGVAKTNRMETHKESKSTYF